MRSEGRRQVGGLGKEALRAQTVASELAFQSTVAVLSGSELAGRASLHAGT